MEAFETKHVNNERERRVIILDTFFLFHSDWHNQGSFQVSLYQSAWYKRAGQVNLFRRVSLLAIVQSFLVRTILQVVPLQSGKIERPTLPKVLASRRFLHPYPLSSDMWGAFRKGGPSLCRQASIQQLG